MKKFFLYFAILFSMFCTTKFVYSATDVLIGKGVANLDSVTSNSRYVEWYAKTAPDVAAVVWDNNVNFVVTYLIRDDSRARGEDQAVDWSSSYYNSATNTWLPDTGAGTSKPSATWGRHEYNGSLSRPVVGWGSSSKAVKFKVDITAKSGSSVTESRYLWIVRSSVTGQANPALYRWMTSRYDRAELYKEMANVWRKLASDPGGNDFVNAMNNVIEIGKGFAKPTAGEIAASIGIESVNLLGAGAALTTCLAEVNGVLVSAVSWLSTATNLLGPGLKDAIVSSVDRPMTKQAVNECTFLASSLDSVSTAVKNDANEMQSLLYGMGGSSASWKQKLIEERNAINSALNDISTARSKISSWVSSYGAFSGVGYGVGSGVNAAAQNVSQKLNQILDGYEKQLQFDKNLLDKMII